jgi:hypothetical protein
MGGEGGNVDKELQRLCRKIESGDVDDEDLLALTKSLGKAIEEGRFPISCGVPIADVVQRKKTKGNQIS